ncbi:FAD/NAD(P)-binding domain-containing protein [Aspergillus heteromorphus CBS 117.55]|uniref:FAD/NAD(P)-binding domain-containing protein n=1 Tax=Aspergillus heteromorphus CBS 117.55 TaxID=1448321 RepID=A0A317VZI3_9EURO|nr:FAD/NAD(P)-binding domain-containing protein [Aspergillus heteromorphus CBS 117.55]PWY78348.1 FAD/NAD(P)-binding domain-containing protein [Aspergillus heteromorphus CBS 117.55]
MARPCKVVIAGGGIAGLALALMLEKHGVDYLLLEAHPELVATVGAGIAMVPNGLRILDQLGCYEDLLCRAQNPVDQIHLRRPDGEPLWAMEEGLERESTERHGYPMVWVDRKTLLEVLFDHIADKSKLLSRRRVATIIHTDDRVNVVTTDGSMYSGDIIVGTDGTHSTVRQEIVRRARELGLGEDYAEEDRKFGAAEVAANYSCIFGMSTAVPGIPSRCIDFVFNENFSYVMGSGPENRVYWFIMMKMAQAVHGSEIPRFTEEDKERAIREHWNDPITPDVRLSDLYRARLRVIYTPIPEFVYKKWHVGRMITIGDACHKVLPITAQGGNQALESAAAVTNGLMMALSQPPSCGPLSLTEVQSMFEQVQKMRSPRAGQIIRTTHIRQQVDAMETAELKHFALNEYARGLPGALFGRWTETYGPAVSLKGLPIPARPRRVLFKDEFQKERLARL